jgi:hypothetical protein
MLKSQDTKFYVFKIKLQNEIPNNRLEIITVFDSIKLNKILKSVDRL